jgi:hypothetical protein
VTIWVRPRLIQQRQLLARGRPFLPIILPQIESAVADKMYRLSEAQVPRTEFGQQDPLTAR